MDDAVEYRRVRRMTRSTVARMTPWKVRLRKITDLMREIEVLQGFCSLISELAILTTSVDHERHLLEVHFRKRADPSKPPTPT